MSVTTNRKRKKRGPSKTAVEEATSSPSHSEDSPAFNPTELQEHTTNNTLTITDYSSMYQTLDAHFDNMQEERGWQHNETIKRRFKGNTLAFILN